MELLLAVVAVAAIVAGTAWTLKGLGMIRDFSGDADTKRRLLDLEVACHELRDYINARTPDMPPGGRSRFQGPPSIPGKDREIDGHADEVFSGPVGMGPGELP